MKNLLKIEEAAQLLACIYAVYLTGGPWWVYLLMALGPDISMLGYLGGNRAGAYVYNIFHSKAVAVCVLFAGWIAGIPALLTGGIIMYGHSSMDRMFGYGLKTTEGFKFTHLGIIGKQKI
jgi:hypothetical protein